MTDGRGAKLPPQMVDAAVEWHQRLEHATPDTERALEAWLDEDPRHREAFAATGENWIDFERMVEVEAGRTRKLERAPLYRRQAFQVSAAACLAATLVGVLVVRMTGVADLAHFVTPAEAATLETGVGEIRTFTLADGTRVTLDTQSMLKARAGGSRAGTRRVELVRGRARFQVAQARAPFVVAVPGGAARSNEATFEVSLLERTPGVATLAGRIELSSNTDHGPPVLVAKGHSAALGSSTVSRLDSSRLLWVNGMLVFDATPLRQAVAAINRYNRKQVVIASRVDRDLTVTGAFAAREPAAFAAAVAAMFRLETSTASDGTITLGRR